MNAVVLFDLDGTLTDPFEGITRSIRYALEELGETAPPREKLSWCIGPPLLDSFRRLLQSSAAQQRASDVTPDLESKALEALRLYRERFAAVGMLENQVYPQIPEVLSTLSESGYRLFVATSKPRDFAVPILRHFDLDQWFQGIYGSELDGTRSSKADLIGHLIRQERLSAESAVMVGDRKHDIEGARAVGARALAVDYGYAAPGELKAAGPDLIVRSPEDIVAGLARLFKCSPT